MKNFLKRQPVETFILFAVPLFLLLFFATTDPGFPETFKNAFNRTLFFHLLFGGYFFVSFVLLLYSYFILKGVIALGQFGMSKIKHFPAKFPRFWPAVRSWLYLLFGIGFASLINGVAVLEFSKSPADRVAAVSNSLMSADYNIFRVAPPFWLQHFNDIFAVDYLLVGAYRSLPFFLVLVLVALLVARRNLFRRFLLSFFLTAFLSMPFWYLWPAISPNEMYRKNILQTPVAENFKNQNFQVSLSANLAGYLAKLENFWVDPSRQALAVTTNPSMHAAWGIIIAYFGIRFWRKFAWALMPWTILNSIGAVYVLEHYVVDILFGAVVALAAIVVVNRLLKWEEKFYQGQWQPFLGIDILQEDTRRFRSLLKSLVNTVF